MARDSLRATLDDLKLDPQSAKDRPYLEAMLRRLGYSEHEIREELGPLVEAEPAPQATAPADDGIAPAREYRLVVPARESAFSFEPPGARPGRDSPFESFDRVEFEPVVASGSRQDPSAVDADPEALEFTEVGPDDAVPQEFAEAQTPLAEQQEEPPLQEFEEAPVQQLEADQPPATGSGVEDVSIDTFGADVDTKPKTRVRVKRVRARSKAEAEAKVASANKKVIKSIPVDIVERWGPGEKADQPKGGKR